MFGMRMYVCTWNGRENACRFGLDAGDFLKTKHLCLFQASVRFLSLNFFFCLGPRLNDVSCLRPIIVGTGVSVEVKSPAILEFQFLMLLFTTGAAHDLRREI